MSSKFKIINLSLRRLGQDPITAIGEDTENYRKVNDIYVPNLKSALRLHPWSFAKEEVVLTVSTTSPVLSDFLYIFPLPSDFLRLNKTSVEPDYSHKIKGRNLYSNSNAVSIEYIKYISDPSAWATGTVYSVGNYVLQSNTIYYCLTAHTSGIFSTDLAANKWVEQDIYDASFTDFFSTMLSYDLCMPITKDAKLKEVLQEEMKWKLNYARSLNGQEQTPDEPNDQDILSARI